MKQKRWLVIGKDERLKYLAKQLANDGQTVFYKYANEWDDELNNIAQSFQPTIVVLPIHPLVFTVEHLQGVQHAHFIVGKLNDKWQQQLSGKKVDYYLENEAFIWANAALTAEGMLAFLYENKQSVRHQTVLITGFGRVAKMLARYFSQLQAKIQIAVRSQAQMAEAATYQYTSFLLSPKMHINADFIINTIPASWLDEQYEQLLNYQIYDLASSPGCLQNVQAPKYQLLAALPGKYFPQAAAMILYETVIELTREDKDCSKENESD